MTANLHGTRTLGFVALAAMLIHGSDD